MKNYLLVLLLFGIITSLKAKEYIRAEIDYENGTHKTMWVGFPIKSNAKKISVKTSENAKPTKIEAENIQMITFSAGEELVHLVHTKYKRFRVKEGEKVFKNKVWLVMIGGCKDVMSFYNASKYKFKNGNLLLEYNTDDGYYYFLKRTGEPEAMMICINYSFTRFVIGGDSYFRANTKRFFADNPILVEKIESKYYDGDLFKLLKDYCDE